MGSSEEEILLQMVQDFIESESNTPISPSSSETHQLFYQNSLHLSLQDILQKASDAETEVLEKILLYLQDIEDHRWKIKNLKKWIILRLKTDNYEASLCKTSWISTFGSPSGDYEYIDVMMMMEDDHENGDDNLSCKYNRLIVDLDFKSQFELARPTPTYSELINALPSIFVGTEEKLNNIISLICPAAKQSLKQNGLHIPPWRKASYMHSKWLSQNCNKVSFFPNLKWEPKVGNSTSTSFTSSYASSSIIKP